MLQKDFRPEHAKNFSHVFLLNIESVSDLGKKNYLFAFRERQKNHKNLGLRFIFTFLFPSKNSEFLSKKYLFFLLFSYIFEYFETQTHPFFPAEKFSLANMTLFLCLCSLLVFVLN